MLMLCSSNIVFVVVGADVMRVEIESRKTDILNNKLRFQVDYTSVVHQYSTYSTPHVE